MEKNESIEPTFDLTSFKRSKFDTTKSAFEGAAELGMTQDDIDALVASIQPNQFYKSMPSKRNALVWQDVYRVSYQGQEIYFKISTGLDTPFRIVSLKKR